MTEKQFSYNVNNNTIEENGKCVAYVNIIDGVQIAKKFNKLAEENKQLKSFKNDVYDLIDELIEKAEKGVKDLREDAYEKGYAYNPYYYWGVIHGLEKLKKELEELTETDIKEELK